jgi:hypothetical protein
MSKWKILMKHGEIFDEFSMIGHLGWSVWMDVIIGWKVDETNFLFHKIDHKTTRSLLCFNFYLYWYPQMNMYDKDWTWSWTTYISQKR